MARSLYSAPAVVTQVPRAGPAQSSSRVWLAATPCPVSRTGSILCQRAKVSFDVSDDHDEVAADGDDDAEKTEVAEVSIVLLFTGA